MDVVKTQKYSTVVPSDIVAELERTLMASFFPEFAARSISEMMRRSGYSYERVHTGLERLLKQGVISEKRVGKTRTFLPSRATPGRWYASFVVYSLKRYLDFDYRYPVAAKALHDLSSRIFPRTIIVFGSYARFQAREASDIDVLCISKKKDKTVQDAALSLRHKYGMKVNAISLSADEFRSLRHGNPQLFDDIRENSIVLNDLSLFFDTVYLGE